jgi:hypothetical protein
MAGDVIGGASNAGWKDGVIPAASAVVKAGPGVLWSFFGVWMKDDPRYLLWFDSAVIPAEGAIPFFVGFALTPVPTSINGSLGAGSILVQFPRARRFYSNGITWAVSNSPNVLSYDSSALLALSVEYA